MLEFSSAAVVETREISADVFVDLDASGHRVSMTIEHASQVASLPQVRIEVIGASVA